jgi:hypothetical protein
MFNGCEYIKKRIFLCIHGCSIFPILFTRDLLGDDTSFKMEVKMNPDGGYHIPGLCYVTVQSVADVNEVNISSV